MKPYTISTTFLGRALVSLRERNGRGEMLGYAVRHTTSTSQPLWSIELAPRAESSDPKLQTRMFGTRAAAAQALFEATTEPDPAAAQVAALAEYDRLFAVAQLEVPEGSVAVCDLCGAADDHSHTIEEYGFPTLEQLQDDEAQVLGAWASDPDRKAGDVPKSRKGRAHCAKHERFVAGCFGCMTTGERS